MSMKNKRVGILLLAFLVTLLSSSLSACNVVKKNSCNCPSKKGMVGY